MNQEKLVLYLKKKFNSDVKINEFKQIGKGVYGTAYLIDFNTEKENKRLVLKTMALGGFGHDNPSDIAGILLWENKSYNKLPKHIKSFDVLGIDKDENITSMGDAEEFYILMEEAKGTEYSKDITRILKDGITDQDRERTKALANYLVKIHSKKKDSPILYRRRARDLVSHGEYIMGVLDSYPEKSFTSQEEVTNLVKEALNFWPIMKSKTHRLCQVHGDFHPFNILFTDKTNFILLDRSRGEYGEAADDVSALAINYIFWSLIKYGCFKAEFKELFDLFFKTYLESTKDEEILEIIQPFFTFRAIVIANPIFYPDNWFKEQGFKGDPKKLRRTLFNFAHTILKEKDFKLNKIEKYLECLSQYG